MQNPNYNFVKKVHLLGPGPTAEQYRDHYARMERLLPEESLSGPLMWQSKELWESFWPTTYPSLKQLCLDPQTRPDFIVADFFTEHVARDMMLECGVPIAVVWPQMPYLLAPASYIPGQGGFQVEVVTTSERASLWCRIRNETALLWALPRYIRSVRWFTNLRRKGGARYPVLPGGSRPHHLVLVNSFFGLEAPKDLPPLMAAVGPVLSEQYPDLDGPHAQFLQAHDRTVYIGLGTNMVLPEPRLHELLRGLIVALDAGHINGVIWSLNKETRRVLDRVRTVTRADGSAFTIGEWLDGEVAEFLVPTFAPQRAVLDHAHTRLYITHGGGSSANEAAFHGLPVLILGFMFDQLANGVRLEEAGAGFRLAKDTFTTAEVAARLACLVGGEDPAIAADVARNVERLRRVAVVASRRKHHAADLIEEVLHDWELRGGDPPRPMHLQTADMRMPWWKARNLDLWLFSLAALVGLPAAAVCGAGLVLRDRRFPQFASLREVMLQLQGVGSGIARQLLAARAGSA